MNFFFTALYNFSTQLYHSGIRIASLWNEKARQWIGGRKNQFEKISAAMKTDEYRTWFHCASAGEFEQGRPLIEAYRKKFPQHKIVLTFFSPSGYELRKNYLHADYIFYLPLDTKKNARQFISLVQPKLAVFVKYEYWFHFLHELKSQNIPLLLVSAIFRKEQVFFRWYGASFRAVLSCFKKIFVQDENSFQLLNQIGYTDTVIAGDTRFDRVWEIAQNPVALPLIERFRNHKKIFVAGSTWREDENALFSTIESSDEIWKWIIVPHEISEDHLNELKKRWKEKMIFFSEATDQTVADKKIMVIDKMGILSSIYQYATIAYVGGGFGKGIHNILEAAVYGIPILFGPHYQKFIEAHELLLQGEARSVKDENELKAAFDFYSDERNASKGVANKIYTEAKKGATEKIMHYLEQLNQRD